MRWWQIRTRDGDLERELRSDLELEEEEQRDKGLQGDEARYAARRAFGNHALIREQTRSIWSWIWLEDCLYEVRVAFRTLCRAPGFTAIAVLVMALGIGTNVALFTVLRGVILKPLPFQDPDRLVMFYEAHQHAGDAVTFNGVAGGIYSAWKKENHTLRDLAMARGSRVALSGSGGQLPEKLQCAELSWNALPTLGVQPAIGRNFAESEDNPAANGTVILSWGLWKRRFGGNPGIVNQTVLVDSRTFTVIGVMPVWFEFPDPASQLWIPIAHERGEEQMTAFSNHLFQVFGRLKVGVTEAQARADLSLISLRIHNLNLDDPFIFRSANSRPLIEALVGNLRYPLYVLFAATACVLLIACLNVANLLVARAVTRRRETAIRIALGGGWVRTLRERVIESLLLSALGGAFGLGFAFGALQWLTSTRQDMNRVGSIHMDGLVGGFTVAVVVFCAVVSGLIAAISAREKGVLGTLHESTRALKGSHVQTRLRRILLSVEFGLTAVLLIGAGLLVKSFERLRSSDMGCTTTDLLTMHLGLPDVRYSTPAQRANVFDKLLERVRALPGVTAAGISEAVPGQGYWGDSSFTIVEHPPLPQGKGFSALNRIVDPGYFGAIGIPLVRGRTFNRALRLGDAKEIVVDRLFADRFLPGEDAIGKHVQTNGIDYVIVGIVGNTRYEIGEEPLPTKYFSSESGDMRLATLVVRANENAPGFALPVQRIVSRMDPDLPVSDVLTMNQLLGKRTLDAGFNAVVLMTFAMLSLLLAGVGLFGVLSYIVSQRTSEIGIRVALGARREQVLQLILLDGMWPALVGLALGIVASAEAARFLSKMLYRTQPLDPAVFAGVTGILLFVAVFACLIPAWRASRLDPMQALRSE
jgi:predicted permease